MTSHFRRGYPKILGDNLKPINLYRGLTVQRKIPRNEMQDTVVNLIDLQFSAGAVAFMLNKTKPNIYSHLKRAGRMEGRNIIRCKPDSMTSGSAAAMRRLCSDPQWVAVSLLTTPQTGSPPTALAGMLRGSETKLTSKRSEKKAA